MGPSAQKRQHRSSMLNFVVAGAGAGAGAGAAPQQVLQVACKGNAYRNIRVAMMSLTTESHHFPNPDYFSLRNHCRSLCGNEAVYQDSFGFVHATWWLVQLQYYLSVTCDMQVDKLFWSCGPQDAMSVGSFDFLYAIDTVIRPRQRQYRDRAVREAKGAMKLLQEKDSLSQCCDCAPPQTLWLPVFYCSTR
ncbi:hypothetical protein GGP41_010516 [Bipolaris sorokiniana]|nr:hypothetical protein GGP41_010516 [Bipolaris sorokiniana]